MGLLFVKRITSTFSSQCPSFTHWPGGQPAFSGSFVIAFVYGGPLKLWAVSVVCHPSKLRRGAVEKNPPTPN